MKPQVIHRVTVRKNQKSPAWHEGLLVLAGFLLGMTFGVFLIIASIRMANG